VATSVLVIDGNVTVAYTLLQRFSLLAVCLRSLRTVLAAAAGSSSELTW
jgi:hypothetical protein